MEILLVLMMLSVIACMTLLFTASFYSQSTLQAQRSQLISLLQFARAQSMQNIDSLAHGLAINYLTKEYVLFSGINFASSNPSQSIKIPYTETIYFASSTPAEIVFNQLSGQSSYEGEITLIFGDTAQSSTTINLNYEGAIY